MGSPADEPERRPSERQHKVTIARAFAIGKTEVTWDQWEACVRDRWCDGPAIEVRSGPWRRTASRTPLHGLRPRHASGGRRQLVRRADVRRLAELEDRRGRRLPPAVRRRVGGRRARRHDDGLSVGRQARSQLRQLRHRRPGLGGKAEGRDQWPTRPPRLGRSRRMRSASTTCPAMSSSGWRTASRRTARTRLRTDRRTSKAIAPIAFFGTALFSAIPPCTARRDAGRPIPRLAEAEIISASASPRHWSERRTPMRSVMLFAAGLFEGWRCTWRSRQSANNGVVMMNHVAVAVPNIAEAVTYYTQKMGYREAFRVARRQGAAAARLPAHQPEHVPRAAAGQRAAARRVQPLRPARRGRGRRSRAVTGRPA